MNTKIPSYIVSVKLTNIDTGTESLLFTREDSRCHFNEKYLVDDYTIQLRLDWGDIENGEPVLDADIWVNSEGRQKPIKKGPWHNTPKELDDNGNWIYYFKFKNFKLRLSAQKTIIRTIPSDACVEKPKND